MVVVSWHRYSEAIDVYYRLNVRQAIMQAGYYMVCCTFLGNCCVQVLSLSLSLPLPLSFALPLTDCARVCVLCVCMCACALRPDGAARVRQPSRAT